MSDLIKVFECKYFNVNLYQLKNSDNYKITLTLKSQSLYDYNTIYEYLQSKNMKKDSYTYDEVIKFIEIILNEDDYKKFINDKSTKKQQSLINNIDCLINKYNMKSQPQLKEQIKEQKPISSLKSSPKSTPKPTPKSNQSKNDGPIKIDNSFIDNLFDNIDSFCDKYECLNPSSQQPKNKTNQDDNEHIIYKDKIIFSDKDDKDENVDLKDMEKKLKNFAKSFIDKMNEINKKEGKPLLEVSDEDIKIIPIYKTFEDGSKKPIYNIFGEGNTTPLKSQKQDETKQEPKINIPLNFKPSTQQGTTYYQDQKNPKKLSQDDLEKILTEALNSIF